MDMRKICLRLQLTEMGYSCGVQRIIDLGHPGQKSWIQAWELCGGRNRAG